MTGEPGAMSDTLVGRVLLGRYRIVRELAKGGMGVVYLARAEGAVGFVKPVVVKLVLPDLAADDRFVAMFAREAQILSHLRHPSVVDVLEFAEQDGVYVMVLEYVRGHHLGQWCKYLKRQGRQAPCEIILQIIIDVLDALHHAHTLTHGDGSSMQIVHRDVSASNVLLDSDGRARLLDFGVARMRGGVQHYQTQVNSFVGKFPYTAPEIFAGGEASPRSDLYACAVVLHEALRGRNPFLAETQAATLQNVLHRVPELLAPLRPDVPEALDVVLAKALAKDPDARHATAAELADDLRGLLPRRESEVRAGLAELLAQDFGEDMARMLRIESLAERDEAWQQMSQPSAPGAGAAAPADLETQVRRARPRAAAAAGEEMTPHTYPSDPNATQRLFPVKGRRAEATSGEVSDGGAQADVPTQVTAGTTPAIAATPSSSVAVMPGSTQALASQRWLLIALFVVGSIALAAIVVALQSRGPGPSTSAAVRIISQPAVPTASAVADPDAVDTDQLPTTEPEPAAPSEPTAAPDPEAASPAPSASKPKARRRGKAGPDVLALTRAFRRQQPKIESCISKHTEQGESSARLEVEFQLDARGQIKRVKVLPAPLAGTALGRCIHQVANATTFPAQGQPVTFAIPVSSSLSRGKR